MPLPDDPAVPWPPKDQQPYQRDAEVADAWWSGDPDKLAAIYGGSTVGRRPSEGGGIVQAVSNWFWGRRGTDRGADRKRVHLPAAADIAATSADLLFGEPPTIQIPEAHGDGRDPDAVRTEDRLGYLIEHDGWTSTLREAAEVCSGIGGVYLRAGWDRDASPDHPILDVVHGDRAVPEFRRGYLTAVTFWRVVVTEGNGMVWRHLERHDRGMVQHGLYVGTTNKLGRRVNLSDHESTSTLDVDTDGVLQGVPSQLSSTLMVRYVPNRRPNRRHRGSPLGQPDTAGHESIMDLLDEIASAWAREVRLVKPRIVVANDFLTHRGRGLGVGFDLDAEVFSPLEMDPAQGAANGITVVDLAKHTDEFIAETEFWFSTLVRSAGYDPQSFGLRVDDSGQVTATEVRAREGRSLKTTLGKQTHWKQAEEIAEIMLVLDAALFGSGVTPMRPRFAFADGLPDDPRTMAETVELLARAEAVSTEAKVRMARPDLETDEVAAEVSRILSERGVQIGDPTGGLV